MAGVHGAVERVRHGVHGVREVRRTDNSGGNNGGGDGKGGSNRAKTSVSQTGVAKTGVAKSVQAKTVAKEDRGGSDLSGCGLLIGIPLPPAGHGGAQVVGAQAHVAGVHEPGGGVRHGVHGVGDAGNHSGGETSVAEVSGVRSGNNNLGVSLPLAVMAEVSVVAVADVADGAGHGVVGGVHTGGGLVAEGVAEVGVAVVA